MTSLNVVDLANKVILNHAPNKRLVNERDYCLHPKHQDDEYPAPWPCVEYRLAKAVVDANIKNWLDEIWNKHSLSERFAHFSHNEECWTCQDLQGSRLVGGSSEVRVY